MLPNEMKQHLHPPEYKRADASFNLRRTRWPVKQNVPPRQYFSHLPLPHASRFTANASPASSSPPSPPLPARPPPPPIPSKTPVSRLSTPSPPCPQSGNHPRRIDLTCVRAAGRLSAGVLGAPSFPSRKDLPRQMRNGCVYLGKPSTGHHIANGVLPQIRCVTGPGLDRQPSVAPLVLADQRQWAAEFAVNHGSPD